MTWRVQFIIYGVMPGLARLDAPGVIHHVIQKAGKRVERKQGVFFVTGRYREFGVEGVPPRNHQTDT